MYGEKLSFEAMCQALSLDTSTKEAKKAARQAIGDRCRAGLAVRRLVPRGPLDNRKVVVYQTLPAQGSLL